MNNRKLTFLLLSTIMFALLAFVLYSTAFSRKSLAQRKTKSLDISRHADEPLELVDLRVSNQSLKTKIRAKFRERDNASEGLDTVEFDDQDDWFKRLNFTLRNTSGKQITGLTAYLYLRPPGSQRLFSATLVGSSTELEGAVLDPGDKIQIVVDASSLEGAITRLRAYGGDPAEATVSLSVEMVAFADGGMWNQGHLVHKDPKDPKKWVPLPSKSPPSVSRLNHGNARSLGKGKSPTFTSRPPQSSERCVLNNGSYQAEYCESSAICFTIFDSGAGPGTSSVFEVSGNCRKLPGPVQHPGVCIDQTIHYLLQSDPSCSEPSPSPTLTCYPDTYINYGDKPCCSGYPAQYGEACQPFTNPSPSPSACFPDYAITFSASACCSGYAVNNICRPRPTLCLPNDFYSTDPTRCCSHYAVDNICKPAPADCSLGSELDCYLQVGRVWDPDTCRCVNPMWHTPLVIDIAGNGFSLTNVNGGINFDMDGDRSAERIAWTTGESDDAFLVLDRNGNGRIDNGAELFGDLTPQAPAANPNGFLALTEFDKSEKGGNDDGEIDSRDLISTQLRLWQDINHNGVSEPSELHLLSELGVESISLDYRFSQRTDRYGNIFRYRAKVYGPNHRDLGRWAYDVILEGEQSGGSAQTRSAIARADAIRSLLVVPISNDFSDTLPLREAVNGR